MGRACGVCAYRSRWAMCAWWKRSGSKRSRMLPQGFGLIPKQTCRLRVDLDDGPGGIDEDQSIGRKPQKRAHFCHGDGEGGASVANCSSCRGSSGLSWGSKFSGWLLMKHSSFSRVLL